MQQNISWQYLAGFYDGEGTVGFRVVKEKRISRIGGELNGWYMTPYLQIANTNIEILQKIKKFLQDNTIMSYNITSKIPHNGSQIAYYLSIQSYEGIKKFFDNIYPYSMKKKQFDIINKFLKLRKTLPTLKNGTKIDNLKRKYWTKDLFLQALALRDELKNTKFRKNVKHKYNYDYFKKLWA